MYVCIDPIYNNNSTSNASLNVPKPQLCFSQHKQAATEGPLGKTYMLSFSLAGVSAENSSLNNTTLNPPVLSIKGRVGRYSKLVGLTKAWRQEKHPHREMSCHYSSKAALRHFSVCAHLFCSLPPRSSCTHKYIITPTARHDDFCFHQLSEMT